MKIAVIQASSQKEKNELLFISVKKAVDREKDQVINFGIFKDEDASYSYIETAVLISLLYESGAVDFIVTGCSSGQGMMLACNSLPGLICGYVQNPSDAYLFGRINDGNAVSLPLGLGFGWSGEINLECTLQKLFDGPFGIGYPPRDAQRKQHDTKILKTMNAVAKRSMLEVLPRLDEALILKALQRDVVYDYIMENGNNSALMKMLSDMR
jgi:ribose 5-phosphate isomerase RpiB